MMQLLMLPNFIILSKTSFTVTATISKEMPYIPRLSILKVWSLQLLELYRLVCIGLMQKWKQNLMLIYNHLLYG